MAKYAYLVETGDVGQEDGYAHSVHTRLRSARLQVTLEIAKSRYRRSFEQLERDYWERDVEEFWSIRKILMFD